MVDLSQANLRYRGEGTFNVRVLRGKDGAWPPNREALVRHFPHPDSSLTDLEQQQAMSHVERLRRPTEGGTPGVL